MKLKRTLCQSTAVVGLMTGTFPAVAQTQPAASAPTEQDKGQLEDIIVTARRVSENQQTVPVSVTAFTGAEIAAKGTRTIEDLALGTPSVSITPATSTKNAAAVSIRGQVQTDNQITLDPSVGVYFDDIYYARAYAALGDLLDVSGVEILKGPQGSLYGRNTIGGAVKVTTNRADPTQPLGGYARVSYGNFNAVDATGALNIPLIPDKLALRIAAAYHRHDGYTHSFLIPTNPTTGAATSLTPIRRIDTDDQASFSQRLSLRFTPTDTFTIDVSGYHFLSSDNGVLVAGLNGDIQNYSFDATPASFTTSPQRQADFYAGLTDTAPFSRTKINAINSTIEWRESDALTAKLILGYVESANRARINSDGTVNGGLDYASFQVALDQKQHQKSAEFQLLGDLADGKLKYVAGLYYFEEKGSEQAPNTLVYSFNANGSTNYVGDATNRSKSIFGNAGYSWTDRFRTSVGLRYTWDNRELVGHTRFIPTGNPGICVYAPGPDITTSTVPGGPCSFTGRTADNYLTYEVNADYRVTKDIFLYAKVGDGTRSGGLQLRGYSGISLQPFKPDKVTSYEAGIKSELIDRHLRLNVSYYHTDYSDTQQVVGAFVLNSLGTNSFVQYTANLGSAKVDGVEVETLARVGEHLTLSGGFGYSKFKYSTVDQVQPEAPEWTYQVGGSFTQPTGLGVAKLDLSYSGKSSFYMATNTSSLVPQGRVPGYGLLDGRLSLALDRGFGIAVFAKNLLAKEYYSNGLELGYSPATTFGFYGIRGMNIGTPRTFGVELSAKF